MIFLPKAQMFKIQINPLFLIFKVRLFYFTLYLIHLYQWINCQRIKSHAGHPLQNDKKFNLNNVS